MSESIDLTEMLQTEPIERLQALKEKFPNNERISTELATRATNGDTDAMSELLGSWSPNTYGSLIDQIIAGAVPVSLPDLVPLQGGGCLLYKGQVHSIAGESGSGKSWLSMQAAAEVLAAGGQVLYLDVETNAVRTIQRMLSLGVDPEHLRQSFHYAHPTEDIDGTAARMIAEWIKRSGADVLVVIDSVGEAISLAGLNPDSDEVGEWIRRVPRQFAEAGAAVLMVDHLPKSVGNGKATFAIGSQRKRAAIDVQLMLDTDRPFSRTTAGSARVRVSKDRDGNAAPGDVIAEMVVKPGADRITISLVSLVGQQPVDPAEARRDALEGRIWTALDRMGAASGNALHKALGGNRPDVLDTAARMEREGILTRGPAGRGGAKPYVLADPPVIDIPPFDADAFIEALKEGAA